MSKFTFTLVIGTYFSWKPDFHKYTNFHGFECSWLGVHFRVFGGWR